MKNMGLLPIYKLNSLDYFLSLLFESQASLGIWHLLYTIILNKDNLYVYSRSKLILAGIWKFTKSKKNTSKHTNLIKYACMPEAWSNSVRETQALRADPKS